MKKLINFREWLLLNEMQHLSVENLPSLRAEPFFYFDVDQHNNSGDPVVEIDMRFEMLNIPAMSPFGSRWKARIPNKIRSYQISRPNGNWIVCNGFYKRSYPLFGITNQPNELAYEQLKQEMHQKLALQGYLKNKTIEEAWDLVIQKIQAGPRGESFNTKLEDIASDWYVKIPKNWMDTALIGVRKKDPLTIGSILHYDFKAMKETGIEIPEEERHRRSEPIVPSPLAIAS